MTHAGEPAIAGWFRTEPEPALLGQRCGACTTTSFPPTALACPNPHCTSDDLELVPLSRRGRVWSYTDAHYPPPPPYVPTTDPYEPFAIAAVELDEERLIVLGQVASGFGTSDLSVGARAELVLEPLDERDGTPQLVWRWRPVTSEGPSSTRGVEEVQP